MIRTHYRIRLSADLTTTTSDRDVAERRARDGYRVTELNEVTTR